MELFDRYTHEIGRRLPKKLRADVEAELHSLLLDALEDRVSKREGNTEPTEADQIAVLEAFGSPSKVAGEYNPHPRYLIGPNLFEAYLTTVTVVASLTAIGFLIALVVGLIKQPYILNVFGRIIPEAITAIVTTLGYITLVFAVLERVIPAEEFEEKPDKPWDPRKLPAVKDSDRVNVAQQIAKIALLVLVLVLFNFFPGYVGIGFGRTIIDSGIKWYIIPLLVETFTTTCLPLLNISWILAIVLSVTLLRQRRWQWWTRLAAFGLEVYGVYILYRFLAGPAIINMDTLWTLGFDNVEAQKTVLAIVLKVLTSIFIVGIIAGIGESIHKLYLVFKTLSATDVNTLHPR